MDERRKQAFMNRASREPFSNILGIRLVDVREGYAVCEMEYTERLDNIHEIAHGGAIFSLIDEAFEISSNTHGTTALALNMNVTFVRMALKNSILRAESTETNKGRRTATYYITVHDSEGLVAICQALVYRKSDEIAWLQNT